MATDEYQNVATLGEKKFVYDALESTQTTIRVAVLLPGDQYPIRIKLRHATFASRPKYRALSYTWGTADNLYPLVINGKEVQVRQNLWDALYYLRDPVVETTLWIDAICIDQYNLSERNQQVSIMSYIYQRAEHVIVWLGEIANIPKAQVKMDNKITRAEILTLCNSPYWKRVWIVQEIGAATGIEIHWAVPAYIPLAHRTVPWELFFDLIKNYDIEASLPKKLCAQRDGRHGDAFLLKNMMVACRESLCEDPRDKIYGFVGIAHDCQDGSFPVDYSKSLYDVYRDVVEFNYASSANEEGREFIDVVFFSQLAQQLLGGQEAMDDDLRMRRQTIKPLFKYHVEYPEDDTSTLTIAGLYGGTISALGPSYEAIIGDPSAMRAWKVLLSKCKSDLEPLRRKSEGFMRVLLELEEKDFGKIAPVSTMLRTKMQDKLVDKLQADRIVSEDSEDVKDLGSNYIQESDQRGRLFTTKDGRMGLVPNNTRLGDFVVQFLDSDVVTVVRIDSVHDAFCHIVGRAVMANDTWTGKTVFQTPSHSGSSYGAPMYFENSTVSLGIDMMTLHLLTS